MRPDCLFPLYADVGSLPGVGPKTAPLLEKLAGPLVKDVLFLAPTGLVDRRPMATVQAAAEGRVATVEVVIGAHRPPPGRPGPGRGKAPYRISVTDAATDFQLVFFRADPNWLRSLAPEGERRVVSGKIEFYDGMAQMVHPDHVLPLDEAADIPAIEPIYPLTAGLTQRAVRKAALGALERAPELEEWIDRPLLEAKGWPSWRAALEALHHPESGGDLDPSAPARQRLAYDELFTHQTALAIARERARRGPGRSSQGDERLRARLYAALPYELTGAQKRTIAEIRDDMQDERRMMRLLQGDVGAGKTLVAFAAMLVAVEAGGQAALMAPTEILARQHVASMQEYLDAVGLRMAALTGRDKGRARAETLEALRSGETDIVIGTHALFQPDVAFKDLRLVVIDEQHRFGVEQRMALGDKSPEGAPPADMLLMTATPIPRSLALAQHGDLDISILDEKPPGRKPIETKLVSLERYDEVVDGLKRALARGARIYWVCPLVEESELSDLAAAEERARTLSAVLGKEAVVLAHGRLTPAEKDAAMRRFASGDAQLLVATTVIEVGVNVPEATVMVVERAERFGLAQLHQLRGRVGRGEAASHCLLLFGAPLSAAARARLSIMRESEDGFRLAEEDLRLRGAGDLIGVKQSGLPKFRIADLERQGDLMRVAHQDARVVIERDPDLQSARGQALRVALHLTEQMAANAFLSAG
ncbi:MAG: ATP-dependent DNA helicase RecG [Neomegalonema sp.]|nr:ATP-dependent DNA helicase RecG [Neomegalonema sp.]